MTLTGFLPLVSLLLICLTIYRRRSAAGYADSGAYALLSGSTLWAALLVAATEVLSFFQALTFPSLLSFWVVAAVVSAILSITALRKSPASPRKPRPGYSLGQKLLLTAILAITATIGLVAFIGPPNTWQVRQHPPTLTSRISASATSVQSIALARI